MDNWLGWLGVGALVLFVVFINVSLITALRRKPGAPESGWARTLRMFVQAPAGERQAREKQAADLAELRRRVSELPRRDE